VGGPMRDPLPHFSPKSGIHLGISVSLPSTVNTPTLEGHACRLNDEFVWVRAYSIPKCQTYDRGIRLSIDTQFCHLILGKIGILHF
jgi:hypothetical protein